MPGISGRTAICTSPPGGTPTNDFVEMRAFVPSAITMSRMCHSTSEAAPSLVFSSGRLIVVVLPRIAGSTTQVAASDVSTNIGCSATGDERTSLSRRSSAKGAITTPAMMTVVRSGPLMRPALTLEPSTTHLRFHSASQAAHGADHRKELTIARDREPDRAPTVQVARPELSAQMSGGGNAASQAASPARSAHPSLILARDSHLLPAHNITTCLRCVGSSPEES